MEVNVINSGSNGNCVTIDDTLIIDAGWNCTPPGLCVLLTHQHTDHTKHLDKMQGLPVYCLPRTVEALRTKHPFVPFNEILPYNTYFFTGAGEDVSYAVTPWEVEHDVPCVGFDIVKRTAYDCDDDERIFYATDFSLIKDEGLFISLLRSKAFDALYIEGNNTLTHRDFEEVFFSETKPRDEFHRRKSYQNHCGIDYLLHLFKRAGYSETKRFTEPVTLLHKSSFYYNANQERLVELAKIVNITNILF